MRRTDQPWRNLYAFILRGNFVNTRNGHYTSFLLEKKDGITEDEAKAIVEKAMYRALPDEGALLRLLFGTETGQPVLPKDAVTMLGLDVDPDVLRGRADRQRRHVYDAIQNSSRYDRALEEIRDARRQNADKFDYVRMSAEIAQTPISKLGLSSQVNEKLRHYLVVGFVCIMTESQLGSMGFGPVGIAEIKQALEKLHPGLRLAWKREDNPPEIERYRPEIQESVSHLAGLMGVPAHAVWRRARTGAHALGVSNDVAIAALLMQHSKP